MTERSRDYCKRENTENNKCVIHLTQVLESSSQQLKNKWCKQLLFKINIIHNQFKNAFYNICLDNLKVEINEDLVFINVSENLNNCTETSSDTRYKAPELINCNKSSKSGDIWATGICIYYINNFNFPWKYAVKDDEKYRLWANKGIFPSNKNNYYSPVLMQMLCVNPHMRQNIENVIQSTLDDDIDTNVLSKLL